MRILDLGCGRGDHLLLFAQLARGALITGLDRDARSLATARQRLEQRNWQGRVRLEEGDLYRMDYPEGHFDLVWSSHVFHGLADLLGAATLIRRVVRPGGRFVLRENRVSARLLPDDLGFGEPGLESRLNAAFEAWLRRDRLERGRYPHGWLHLLRNAGFAAPTARSFLYEIQSPIPTGLAQYLRSWLGRRAMVDGVSDADRQLVAALCNPEHPQYFLKRDDLHFTAVSSIYIGTAGR